MIKVYDYETFSAKYIQLVIDGMRNSWESWEKADSVIFREHVTKPGMDNIFPVEVHHIKDTFHLGDNDKDLAQRLMVLGPDHGKFLRQLPFIMKFSAPEYFLKEFDTYKIGTVRNSTSMMHKLGAEPFRSDMFSFENIYTDIQDEIITALNALRLDWINAGKKKGPQAAAWRAMVQAIPQGWNYLSTWSGNYQVLRNMYFARRKHRLQEWREFCDFMTQLPYSELITYDKTDEKEKGSRDNTKDNSNTTSIS